MSQKVRLNCPECGAELEIPVTLTEFSCLYCGKRSQTQAVLFPTERPKNYEQSLSEFPPRLLEAVKNYPDYYKKITKKAFFSAFDQYEQDNEALLKELDIFARRDPSGVDSCMETVCKGFLDVLEGYMSKDKRWNSKSNRHSLFFEVKVVLAIFLTPLVKKLNLATAESFRTILHRQWMERYPEERWEPGDYDALAGGFRKGKLCYITTAVCRFEGKADDCAELTAFRAFRDGWLTEQGGEALIEEYYEKAPSIVTCIELCDCPEERYAQIRRDWLTPCYEALQSGRMEDCKACYMSMVRSLGEKYLKD